MKKDRLPVWDLEAAIADKQLVTASLTTWQGHATCVLGPPEFRESEKLLWLWLSAIHCIAERNNVDLENFRSATYQDQDYAALFDACFRLGD